MEKKTAQALSTAIYCGNVGEIERILATSEGKKVLNNVDNFSIFHWTSLHVACGYKTTPGEVVSLLLEHGADPNITDHAGNKPIISACKSGNRPAIDALMNATTLSKNEQFLVACSTNNTSLLRELYGDENQLNLKDGMTPLQFACINGSVEAAEYLLQHGAKVHPAEEPSTYDDDGYYGLPNPNKPEVYSTPIHQACRNGSVLLVNLLMNWGADITALDDNTTPIHIAVQTGNKPLLEYLLARVDPRAVNADDRSRETPMQIACRAGNIEIIEMLIAKGGNINFPYDGNSPLVIASYSGNMEVLECLLKHGAAPAATSAGDTLLHEACHGGNMSIVEKLLSMGMDANATNKKHETPLHLAVISGKTRVVEYMCQYTNVNTITKDGKTALHLACSKGFVEISKILIKHGALVDVADKDNVTPCYIACETKNETLLKLLIEHKANLNKADADGIAPIHLICSSVGQSHLLELLLDHKVNIQAKDQKHGKTPLHLACQVKDKQMVKMLASAGANIDAPLEDGDTPLFFACANKDLETAKFLIESGASIHTTNKYGKTILMVVVAYQMFDFSKYLISCGVDINKSQRDGITALSIAAATNDIKTVEMLLSHKADPNIPDRVGKTPLYDACIRNYVPLAELLARHGATFGELENKPVPKSNYGAKSIKDAKNTEAGKAAQKIISSLPKQSKSNENLSQTEKESKGTKLLSLFSKK